MKEPDWLEYLVGHGLPGGKYCNGFVLFHVAAHGSLHILAGYLHRWFGRICTHVPAGDIVYILRVHACLLQYEEALLWMGGTACIPWLAFFQ